MRSRGVFFFLPTNTKICGLYIYIYWTLQNICVIYILQPKAPHCSTLTLLPYVRYHDQDFEMYQSLSQFWDRHEILWFRIHTKYGYRCLVVSTSYLNVLFPYCYPPIKMTTISKVEYPACPPQLTEYRFGPRTAQASFTPKRACWRRPSGSSRLPLLIFSFPFLIRTAVFLSLLQLSPNLLYYILGLPTVRNGSQSFYLCFTEQSICPPFAFSNIDYSPPLVTSINIYDALVRRMIVAR